MAGPPLPGLSGGRHKLATNEPMEASRIGRVFARLRQGPATQHELAEAAWGGAPDTWPPEWQHNISQFIRLLRERGAVIALEQQYRMNDDGGLWE